MAAVNVDTNQILATIKAVYLRPLIEIMGRAAGAEGVHGSIDDAGAGGAAATATSVGNIARVGAAAADGLDNTCKQNWNATQFKKLATQDADATLAPGANRATPAGGSIPPATFDNVDYSDPNYQNVYFAGGAGLPNLAGLKAAAAAPGAGPIQAAALAVGLAAIDNKKMVKIAVLSDLGLTVDDGAGGVPAVGAVAPSTPLGQLIGDIFDDGYVLNENTNKLIFPVPKSDEIMRRLLSSIYAKKMDLPVSATATGGGNLQTTDVATAIQRQARKKLYNTMPKSESDAYLALITLTPEEKDSLNRFDRHIDEIRAALSEGPATQATNIAASNIVRLASRSNISSIKTSPHREAILNRRRSDPSNPLNAASAMNRINIALNTGSGMMRGGASKNKAGPLYPKIVMHGGSHPFAVLEGGAAALPTRDAPNTVALLDARIRELQGQFKSATGKDLDPTLSGRIVGYSSTIYDRIKDVQKGLNTLADANKALAQYPVGLGIDAGTFSESQLKNITTQADEINKNALKASKQITKLEQIADTLEELVKKSSPARRV